jgi:hypothetical protein
LARWHHFHVESEASSEMSRIPLRAADMAGLDAKLLRPNAQCPLLELAEWASPPISTEASYILFNARFSALLQESAFGAHKAS